MINVLLTYIQTSSIYLRGQRLIEVKLNHLLTKKHIELRLNASEESFSLEIGHTFSIEFSPSLTYDFTNLDEMSMKFYIFLSFKSMHKSMNVWM